MSTEINQKNIPHKRKQPQKTQKNMFLCFMALTFALGLFLGFLIGNKQNPMKFKNFEWKENKYKYLFVLGCIPCFLLGTSSFAIIILWYVLLSMARKHLPA